MINRPKTSRYFYLSNLKFPGSAGQARVGEKPPGVLALGVASSAGLGTRTSRPGTAPGPGGLSQPSETQSTTGDPVFLFPNQALEQVRFLGRQSG